MRWSSVFPYVAAFVSASSEADTDGSSLLSVAHDSFWKPIGCFEDSPVLHIIPRYEKPRPDMNVATCTAMCLARNMPFAALKTGLPIYIGQQCFCMTRFRGAASSKNCDQPCEGNARETCGGRTALSVYTYSGSIKPRTNKLLVKTTTNKIYRYGGCWQDIAPYRVMSGAYSRAVTEKSIEQCAEFCSRKDFTMFGLKFYGVCYCANLLDGSQAADPLDCNLPCSNNESEICGGKECLYACPWSILTLCRCKCAQCVQYRTCLGETISDKSTESSSQVQRTRYLFAPDARRWPESCISSRKHSSRKFSAPAAI